MKRILMVLVMGFVVAGTSFAQDSKKSSKGESHRSKWGMAGCGLWSSAVITNRNQWAQLGAVLLRTYFIYDSQSSAITSGTSNCDEGFDGLAAVEQKVFVDVNIVQLEKDAAQGGGEYLSAFADLLGCKNEQELNKVSQDNFDSIFSNKDSNAVLNQYREKIKSNENLAKSCSRVDLG